MKQPRTTRETIAGLGVGDSSFALIGPSRHAAANAVVEALERERGWKFEVTPQDDWLFYRRIA